MPESGARSDTQKDDSYTMVRSDNVLILSTDKDKQVTQYQPIIKNDIPDRVIKVLDGIIGELE
jgi:hypothetical protein